MRQYYEEVVYHIALRPFINNVNQDHKITTKWILHNHINFAMAPQINEVHIVVLLCL